MYVIAHRAKDKNKIENSNEAILSSLTKKYIDGIEIDIRITKDNVWVINHGPIVLNKNYDLKIVEKTNYKNIKKIIVDRTIITLPILEDVLKQINTKKIIMIEIKTDTKNYKKIIKSLSNVLDKFLYLNLYLCSFNYELIKELKNSYHKFKLGLNIGYQINVKSFYNHFDFNVVQTLYINKINKSACNFIYNVNSIKKLEELKKIVNNINIITDKPYLDYHNYL